MRVVQNLLAEINKALEFKLKAEAECLEGYQENLAAKTNVYTLSTHIVGLFSSLKKASIILGLQAAKGHHNCWTGQV